MLSNNSLDFISDMGVTDHRHCDRQFREQKRESSSSGCSLKNSSFWKLFIYLETYMKQRQ